VLEAMSRLKLCAVLFISLSIPAMAAVPIMFPGPQTIAQSPSGQQYLVWSEVDGDQPHLLSFRDKNGNSESVMHFERSVTVQWAPDSKAFAILDAYASDESRVSVSSVSVERKVVRLSMLFPAKVEDALAANDHTYFKLVSWTTSGLRLLAWGYGPGKYKYNLNCQGSALTGRINCS
jgi:hypothetical protein